MTGERGNDGGTGNANGSGSGSAAGAAMPPPPVATPARSCAALDARLVEHLEACTASRGILALSQAASGTADHVKELTRLLDSTPIEDVLRCLDLRCAVTSCPCTHSVGCLLTDILITGATRTATIPSY